MDGESGVPVYSRLVAVVMVCGGIGLEFMFPAGDTFRLVGELAPALPIALPRERHHPSHNRYPSTIIR